MTDANEHDWQSADGAARVLCGDVLDRLAELHDASFRFLCNQDGSRPEHLRSDPPVELDWTEVLR